MYAPNSNYDGAQHSCVHRIATSSLIMAPKRKVTKKQQPITELALPLLKKPLEQIGKQINVPGSFWSGRMSAEERSTLYKCTVRDFTHTHKFPGEQAPRAAFQLQEMGVTGTGSTEPGDSSGEIFWMPYPTFLGFFYQTFPEMITSRCSGRCATASLSISSSSSRSPHTSRTRPTSRSSSRVRYA